MAEGRMLQKRISQSRQVARLVAAVDERLGQPHGAYAALLFTWAISHLDREGRMHGDPSLVKSTVLPRLPGITDEHVAAYLAVAAELELIHWYSAKDDLWLAFPGFDRSQVGLRKDRETPSRCPPPDEGSPHRGPTPRSPRTNSGAAPDLLPLKGSEEKGSEENILSLARARDERNTTRAAAETPPEAEAETSPPHADPRRSWGTGRFESAWQDELKKTPGETHRWHSLAERIATAAKMLTAPVEPEPYARRLFVAYVEFCAWCPTAGWHEPPLSVAGFERNFERVEEWAAGKRPTPKQQPAAQSRPSPADDRPRVPEFTPPPAVREPPPPEAAAELARLKAALP